MPDSLDIELQNQTNFDQVWAYITGIAISNGQRVLVQANGRDLYYPQQVANIGTPLQADCAIPLGPPGNTTTVHIPQMAGGRIWFSCHRKLTFLLNPGPALVEPSVLNPTDPNADVNFGFAEFTLNNDQLFANISYVDFVSQLPIALTLETAGGAVQHVSGMAPDGIARLCEGLRVQAQKDGWPWHKLVVQDKSNSQQQPLRILSPTHGEAVGASFANYYEDYVEDVWKFYSKKHGGNQIRLNTQAAAGWVTGYTDMHHNEIVVGDEKFSKPSSSDILGCNSGPFTTGPSAHRNSIIPRLAAAFQRSSLALQGVDEHPSDPSTFYTRNPTNHYCRLVHEVNLDGKGYAFAYDDVQPDGGADQSGKVNAGDPKRFIVAVGGQNAYVGDQMPPAHGGHHYGSHHHHHHDAQQTNQPPPPPPVPPPSSRPPPQVDGAFDNRRASRLDRISAKAQKWLSKYT